MQLIHGDCLEQMDILIDKGVQVDAIITDPPYKIISGGCRIKKQNDEPSGILTRRRDNKRQDWIEDVRTGKMFKHNEVKFSEWLPRVFSLLKEETHFYVMVNDKNMQEMLNEAIMAGFKLHNVLVWKKNNATPNKWYMKNCEFIIFFRKGKAKTINNMGTKQCLEIDNMIGNKSHPTEKPIELIKVLIKNSTHKIDVVLDPFMGSGTTGVACVNTNRQFIGIELDDKYFKIAEDRINDAIYEKANDLFN